MGDVAGHVGKSNDEGLSLLEHDPAVDPCQTCALDTVDGSHSQDVDRGKDRLEDERSEATNPLTLSPESFLLSNDLIFDLA